LSRNHEPEGWLNFLSAAAGDSAVLAATPAEEIHNSMSLLDALLLEPRVEPREVWIARRTDGLKGSGTLDDPYDGSTRQSPPVLVSRVDRTGANFREAILATTRSLGLVVGDVVSVTGVTGPGAAFWNGTFPVYDVVGNEFRFWMKRNGTVLSPQDVPAPGAGDQITVAKITYRFDDVMRQLAAQPNTFLRIHIGPGTFETRGFAEAAINSRPQVWWPRRGMHISGSGIDVTVLKIVFADVEGGNYYAISSVIYGVQTHYAEVSDLTVDSNLPGQPLTRGRDYANIACSAVALSGAFCRIRRVKAINWGSQHPTTEAFVLATAGAHPDFPNDEHVLQIIEDCICVQPSENNQYTSTIIHTTGGSDPIGRHFYSRAAILRRNFVDSAFKSGKPNFTLAIRTITHDDGNPVVATIETYQKHGRNEGDRFLVADVAPGLNESPYWFGYFEVVSRVDDYKLTVRLSGQPPNPTFSGFAILQPGALQGLSVGGTEGCLVEDNVVFNSSLGGPYQDTGNTKEIIVRRNYYKNVAAGVAIVNGNTSRGPLHLKSLKFLGELTAEATTYEDHGFANNDAVRVILASPSNYNGVFLGIHDVVRDFSNKVFTFQYELFTEPPGDGDGGIVELAVAGISSLKHIADGIAEARTTVETGHRIAVGDRLKISNAFPDDFNGFVEVTAVGTTLPSGDLNTFQYNFPTALPPNATAQHPTFQRLWGVDRLIVEDNVIELRQHGSEYGTPIGITIGDNNLIHYPEGLPPFVHGDIAIRNNAIRVVEGLGAPGLEAWGIFLPGAKRSFIHDNIIDVPLPAPLRDWRSGDHYYLNNRTAAGTLVQGLNANARDALFQAGLPDDRAIPATRRTDLEVDIEDVVMLSS
jgi:hypothetical protein